MVDAKTAAGNDEITSQGFLSELANLERKIASGLLEADPKDIPTDYQCDEASHNVELAKAWKEVNRRLIKVKT